MAGLDDRDASDVRGELAHTRRLDALRETQRELAEAQHEMRTGMAQIVTLLGGAPPA